MLPNEFFKVKDNDIEIISKEITRIKQSTLDLIDKSTSMTVKEFYSFNKKNEEIVENILCKYNFLSTNFQSENILNTLNQMNSIVIEGFKELNFNEKFYNFIKNLLVEDEEDLFYKEKKIKALEENGIHLCKNDQEKIISITKKIMEYQSNFTKNIFNARKNFCVKISKSIAEGLSDEIRNLFDEELTLKYSPTSVIRILRSCKSEIVRSMVYEEDQKIANKGTDFDNTKNIEEIVRLKNEKSKILGFKNTGDQILKDTMAENIESAYSLLENMRMSLLPIAKEENKKIKQFAKAKYGMNEVDFSSRLFISEEIKSKKLSYLFEEEKKYLNVNNVLKTSIELIKEMYGVQLVMVNPFFDLASENLIYFKSYENGVEKGKVIFDLYERKSKKTGAWVSNYIANTKEEKGFQVLNTNFKYNEGLSFEDFRTLLHELGHLVHGIVSDTKYSNVSGTRGLPRDAVEIPSMAMEKFAYEKDILLKASNGTIPLELIEKAKKIKNFMAASFYIRQVGISMYDLTVFNTSHLDIYGEYKKNMDYATGLDYRKDANFPMVFTHIFSGGYSSGYYGYLWSEIYAADIFSLLKSDPIKKGKDFKDGVLSYGGSKSSKYLYEKLLQRPVNVSKFNDYLELKKEENTQRRKLKMK